MYTKILFGKKAINLKEIEEKSKWKGNWRYYLEFGKWKLEVEYC